MHPSRNVLALCHSDDKGRGVQIYDLDTKTKLKDVTFKEDIMFARWVNDCFAFLTITGIYHLELGNDKEPKVMGLPKAIP
jgi:hypothetical protein